MMKPSTACDTTTVSKKAIISKPACNELTPLPASYKTGSQVAKKRLHIRVKPANREAPTTVQFLRAVGGKIGQAALNSHKMKTAK
jgi:hypothetical protein